MPRMSTFTLAISCLTTSNFSWFMDLTFQIPMQYYSLQHRTLLLLPATSTTGYCFCFGSIPSFFLKLFLHWSPVAYWAPPDLGSFSFNILLFCLFILFIGFSRQEYWSGLPFLCPVDHILSDLSTMTCPSWVATRAWLSFIELDKSVVLVWLDWLVFLTGALSTAERSYPTSDVRGRSREDPMSKGRQPRVVTPCPRSGAVAKSARLWRRRNGRE